MKDTFDLARFTTAQAPVIESVTRELRAGRKNSHWMWFIFPQLAGLGRSGTARHYAISGIEEARAFLAHPLLGPRLADCTNLVLGVSGSSAYEIFSSPDDVKFHSSMTLFQQADPAGPFGRALMQYFSARPDARTLDLLKLG